LAGRAGLEQYRVLPDRRIKSLRNLPARSLGNAMKLRQRDESHLRLRVLAASEDVMTGTLARIITAYRLRSRHPMMTPARITSGPTPLTGSCFWAKCGGPRPPGPGKGSAAGMFRSSDQGPAGQTGCTGRSIPMDRLNNLIANHLEERLLQPERLETI